MIRTLIFAALTFVVIAGAWQVSKQRAPETAVERLALFPDLQDKVNDIASVEIKSAGDASILAKQGDIWVVKNRDDYPAMFEQIRELVLSIIQLQIIEAKTKNKERYTRLGVDDIDAKDAESTRVTLFDKDQKALAAVILGKERFSKAGSAMRSLYVRPADQEQSYLVKGSTQASAVATDWLSTELFDISSDRIRGISISHPDKTTVEIQRDSSKATNYTLQDIADDHKLISQVTLNSLASAFEDIRFEDVMSRQEADLPTEGVTTIYQTFDGLVATVSLVEKEDKKYASFSFAYDPSLVEKTDPESDSEADDANDGEDEEGTEKAEAVGNKEEEADVEEEVKRLAAATEPWAYVLPSYKSDLLTKTRAGLIEKKPAEEEKEESSEKDDAVSLDLEAEGFTTAPGP